MATFSDINVDYVDHMGEDISVVNAARVSFAKIKEAMDSGDEKLIGYLASHDHWSPFAHAFMSFRIKAPMFVARQLVKHQIGLSWNEESRRYIKKDPEFYMPEAWRAAAANVKQGSSANTVDVASTYCANGDIQGRFTYESVCDLADQVYRDMLEQGVAPEQARIVLPVSAMTEWIWSGSLFAFARVANQRLDSHAQKETRMVAQAISDIAQDLFPVSWKTLVLDNNHETGQT